KELSTMDLVEERNRPDSVIVDIRPLAAYNGWPLQGEPCGGHIPGAKSLPQQWTQYMDWVEVLDEKNIAGQCVILYGYDAEKTDQMAGKLQDLGFQQISTYHHFIDEWTQNSERPMDQLPRYKHLVYPEWVKQL